MSSVDEKVLVTISYPHGVPDLYQLHLLTELVRGIHYDRIKVLKKTSKTKNIYHTCYIYHPKRIFALEKSNKEYLVRKGGTVGCYACKKPKVACKGQWSLIVTHVAVQTTSAKAT